MNKECPCTNCITFPICRNIVIDTFKIKQKEYTNDDPFYRCSYFRLIEKCCLIKKYFSDYNIDLPLEMHKIFDIYRNYEVI